MRSYFGEPEETAKVLSADGWLDTGDLGYRLDGEIVITGRAKDLIIVNGRNVWPQDLEWTAEAETPACAAATWRCSRSPTRRASGSSPWSSAARSDAAKAARQALRATACANLESLRARAWAAATSTVVLAAPAPGLLAAPRGRAER